MPNYSMRGSAAQVYKNVMENAEKNGFSMVPKEIIQKLEIMSQDFGDINVRVTTTNEYNKKSQEIGFPHLVHNILVEEKAKNTFGFEKSR